MCLFQAAKLLKDFWQQVHRCESSSLLCVLTCLVNDVLLAKHLLQYGHLSSLELSEVNSPASSVTGGSQSGARARLGCDRCVRWCALSAPFDMKLRRQVAQVKVLSAWVAACCLSWMAFLKVEEHCEHLNNRGCTVAGRCSTPSWSPIPASQTKYTTLLRLG